MSESVRLTALVYPENTSFSGGAYSCLHLKCATRTGSDAAEQYSSLESDQTGTCQTVLSIPFLLLKTVLLPALLLLVSMAPLFASQTHSQRSFTYIINPIHTDCYFSSDSEGEEPLGSTHEITDTSSSTRQYYLHFSSNEMGTHKVGVSITPLVQTVNGTAVAIPVTISVLDETFSDVAVFDFDSSNTDGSISNEILSVEIDGAETVNADYAFTYDFGEDGALDAYPAGSYSSTVTLTYSYER